MAIGIASFPSTIGSCGVAWNDTGICSVLLPEASDAATRDELLRRHPDASLAEPPALVAAAIERMTGLLEGQPDDLRDVEVDFGETSDFAQQVWDITRAVGPGETTTYGEIAQQMAMPHAAREVGQALGRNPVPIIVPCHRVLGAGGKMVGFSAPGGVATKLRILGIEGAAAPDGQTALF
jgi:methylated-DNA-[protein]-cysteine S-methyltransferase